MTMDEFRSPKSTARFVCPIPFTLFLVWGGIVAFSFPAQCFGQEIDLDRPPSDITYPDVNSPEFNQPDFQSGEVETILEPVESFDAGSALETGRILGEPRGVDRFKKKFLQRLSIAGEWVPGADAADWKSVGWDASASFAIPLGSFQNLLIATPSFQTDYVDLSNGIPVPDALYSTGVDFMWRKEVSDRFSFHLAAQPSLMTDFHSANTDIRVMGRALATWESIPDRLSITFGAVYLDRNDLGLLPALGLTWTPSDEWKFDVTFPRPRIGYRLEFIPEEREDWVYLAGRLGGRTWNVERSPGVDDELTLSEYRLGLGWERIRQGGGGAFAELGWAFGREMEYELSPLSRELGDSFFIRTGISY